MNGAVEKLLKEALKATFANPKESAFLVKYAAAAKSAAQRRNFSENQGTHIPPFLIASIASACNLSCKGCYARANQSCGELPRSEDLTGEQWGGIFREAAELGVSFVLLAGGEPLTRRDVIEEASRIPQILFPVFTNGTMMEEPLVALFYRSRNLVPVFSMEGNEAQTDARRGGGVYRTLLGAMEVMSKKGLLYGISITVTAENLETVTGNDFIGLMFEKGCRLIFFVEYVPVGNAADPLAPGDRERAVLAERQAQLRSAYQNMIFLSFPGDEKEVGGCLAAGRGFFHIGSAGSAEPCPFSPYSDTSLKNVTLKEALGSPLFRKLNEEGLLLQEHTGGCVLFGQEEKVRRLLDSRKL
jgi:Predicted Fe-S oxidoreductases